MSNEDQRGETRCRGLPVGTGHMDDGVALIGSAHVVEQIVHTVQTGFATETYVTIEICDGMLIVHEKAPGG